MTWWCGPMREVWRDHNVSQEWGKRLVIEAFLESNLNKILVWNLKTPLMQSYPMSIYFHVKGVKRKLSVGRGRRLFNKQRHGDAVLRVCVCEWGKWQIIPFLWNIFLEFSIQGGSSLPPSPPLGLYASMLINKSQLLGRMTSANIKIERYLSDKILKMIR